MVSPLSSPSLSIVDRTCRFLADLIVHVAVLTVHRLVVATNTIVVYPRRQAEEERTPVRCLRLFGTAVFLFLSPLKCNLLSTSCTGYDRVARGRTIYSRFATDGENSHPFSVISARLG